jgi:NADH-quinone oxidoreductase subunit J
MDLISFFIFGGLAILASLGVIAQRNVMHSVMLLIVSFGALLSVLLAIEIVWGLSKISLATFGNDPGVISKISSVTTIGQALFTTHSFAFEVTSILILVAMMGAVVIAGKPRRES